MNDAHILKVDLGARAYDIHIGKNLLDNVAALIPLDLSDKKIFILYDKNVYPYAQIIEEALGGKCADSKMLAVKGGEPTKSYSGLQDVLNWLLDYKVNRQSVLVAVGGGVVGDLGGFAASIILRGIPFVQIPTTLLAQVDSAVGGKTGINAPQGKNLVGSFYQPQAVLCDTGTLATLPERELKAGYAEVVKYGFINNPEFFEWLEEQGQDVLDLKPDAITHAVKISCETKANIVAADEREGGIRALLNLGHTFGHAIEAAAGYDGRVLHGEAVSIGMVMAFALSVKMGLCPAEDLQKATAHLQRLGLKTSLKDISPALKHSAEELVDLMAGDKKAHGDKIGFILVRGIGQAFQEFNVARQDVIDIIKEDIG